MGFCPSGTPPLRLKHDCCTAGILAPVIHVPFNPSFNIKNHTKTHTLGYQVNITSSLHKHDTLLAQSKQSKKSCCVPEEVGEYFTYISVPVYGRGVDEKVVGVSQIGHGHHVVVGGEDRILEISDHGDGDWD